MTLSLKSTLQRHFIFMLLAAGAVLGLMGTDLVLPAIPLLPDALNGTPAQSQWVIAAFVAGTALGLLFFGAVGQRVDRAWLLTGAMALYAVASFLAGMSSHMAGLIELRFLQGWAASAPAVFAPGMIRAQFSDAGAMRAVGVLGSLESLAPALAPVLGLWLLDHGGWPLSFQVTAGVALFLTLAYAVCHPLLARRPAEKEMRGSYLGLIRSPVYLRYALSQAMSVSGLLIFVFGAPAVIVLAMDGQMSTFIAMQIVGITAFIIASNAAGPLAERLGAERMISFGTGLGVAGSISILIYALAGDAQADALIFLFLPVNLSIGLRGPPGFFRAIVAGKGDDDRAASLLFLTIMAVSSAGTALLAPFITEGLAPLAFAACLPHLVSALCLMLLPGLPENEEDLA